MRKILWLFLLLLVPAHVAAAPSTRLDTAIAERLAQSATPGISVAVIDKSGVITEHAYGLRDVETRQPVVPAMLFRNGSGSKMWVAAALLQEMEKRKISVKQPIGSFVPGLAPMLRELTVHQLLSHTSGLADMGNDFGLHDETALAARVKDEKNFAFFTKPGQVVSYSNPAFDLAGYVLEHLSGKPFADALDALVMKPVGADRTMFRPTMAMTYPFALGHGRDEKGALAVVRPMPDNAAEWPSGLGYTTAGDAAKFAHLFLNGGRTAAGEQVLSPAVMTSMMGAHGPFSDSPIDSHYGYGLFVRTEDGERLWDHGGSITGYTSLVTILPERGIVMAIMSNGQEMKLLQDIRDLVLEERGQKPLGTDSRGSRAPTAEEMAKFGPVAGSLAASLVGDWGQIERSTTIRRNGSDLMLAEGEKNVATIRAAGKDRFGLISPEGKFMGYFGVVKDAQGNARYLHRGYRALVRLPQGK